jgi:hypothetical protein
MRYDIERNIDKNRNFEFVVVFYRTTYKRMQVTRRKTVTSVLSMR